MSNLLESNMAFPWKKEDLDENKVCWKCTKSLVGIVPVSITYSLQIQVGKFCTFEHAAEFLDQTLSFDKKINKC